MDRRNSSTVSSREESTIRETGIEGFEWNRTSQFILLFMWLSSSIHSPVLLFGRCFLNLTSIDFSGCSECSVGRTGQSPDEWRVVESEEGKRSKIYVREGKREQRSKQRKGKCGERRRGKGTRMESKDHTEHSSPSITHKLPQISISLICNWLELEMGLEGKREVYGRERERDTVPSWQASVDSRRVIVLLNSFNCFSFSINSDSREDRCWLNKLIFGI